MIKDKKEILREVKNAMKVLDDYSGGEEELLCMMTLNLSREKFFIKEKFNQKEYDKIKKVLNERLKNKPLNKIFKKQTFFGIDFFINNNVLAPRVETEILAEMVLKEINKGTKRVLDLCCGSGCIGLTLSIKILNKVEFVLSDISEKALYVARKNRKLLNQNAVRIVKSDLFRGLKKDKKFDIIVCNPPYIKSKDIETLSKGVKNFDPHIALDGGKSGLEFYEKIAQNVTNFLTEKGKIFLEIGFDEKEDVQNIFNKNGFITKCYKDFSGQDRVVEIKRGSYD